MSSTLMRRAVVSAATASVLVGAALASAPAATAAPPKPTVGSSACTHDHADRYAYVDGAKYVHLRSGPGTGWTSRGLLYDDTDVDTLCTAKKKTWFYLKVLNGKNKGKKGWVYRKYLFPFN